jgi:crotonobetainyl-CoA:carnitine CoA-transferase CaiB-like acyl-CoA transferase
MAGHQGPAAAVGTDLSLCGIRILDVASFIAAPAAATVLPCCITGAMVPRPGPALGTHSVEILGEVGNDAEAIATGTTAGALPWLRTMSRGQYT